MLCRRQWTDEYVERPETLMRQNVVIVWLECLLVNVVRHTGMLAPDHVDICMPKHAYYYNGTTTSTTTWLVVWLNGNTLVSINEVTLSQAGLVLGWVTVYGRVNHLSTYQPPM